MNDSPLARYLVPLRRWWWIVFGLILLAVGLAWLTLPEQLTQEEIEAETTSFRATHLLIRNPDAPAQLNFDLIMLLAQQGDLINRVDTVMGDRASTDDVAAVILEPNPTTNTISVTAIQSTPELASELSTTFALQLVTFLDERTTATLDGDLERVRQQADDAEVQIERLRGELETLAEDDIDRRLVEAELNLLVDEYAQLRTQERSLTDQRAGIAASFDTLQEPSPVPADAGETSVLALPASPVLRIGLAALLGLVLGIVVVLVRDYVDTRVRTRRDAEEAFGLPVIAEIPSRSARAVSADPIPAHSDPGSVTAEVVRALRLSLSLAPTWHLSSLSRSGDGAVGTKTPVQLPDGLRSMVVTSPLTGDGKSTLVANLAVSLAEGGKHVLVVDCDFRRPAVGKLLDVIPGVGLRDLAHLEERPLLDLAAPTMAENVAMVRAGSVGVTPSWFMAEAGKLVEMALEIADLVIFDTGPITLTNEAAALLPNVDTSLVVARAGKVATDQARHTIEQLTQVGAHVSGVVLVGSEARRRYGYGYYTDGAKKSGPADDASAAATGAPAVDSTEVVEDPAAGESSTAEEPSTTEVVEEPTAKGTPAAKEVEGGAADGRSGAEVDGKAPAKRASGTERRTRRA